MTLKTIKKIIIISVLFMFIAYVILYLFPIKNNDNNTMYNIKNGGFIAKDNNCVYYINANNNHTLHSYNLLNKEDRQLYGGDAVCVNVVGDWIYFSKGDPGNICRIKKGGNFIHTVTFREYYSVIIKYGYIFAIESKEGEEQKLYRINLNGGRRKLIYSNIGRYYDIYDNKIYFSNGNDNYKLYSCDINGNNIKKAVNKPIDDFFIFNNYIYYSDMECNYIFKNNLLGTDENILYKGSPWGMTVANSHIVFNDKGTMYLMGLNGENLTAINKGVFANINSIGNLIIYTRPVQTDKNKSGMYMIDIYNKKEVPFSIDDVGNVLINKES